ncbi:dihydrofolate reductase family protein [Sphingobacterium sp.]|uniref:dihydrofolate reductase family protein n=1 Tax=Sphingobacterium sp. TaxID=341027 RepID=UPI0028A07911|nr:dihydrofolate reductase family protein [Sphingobacterium sp.]
MRKLIMKMSISVDGFVADINGETGWMFKSGDDHSRSWVLNICASAGLHIMGRKTFEVMASYWPTATNPFAGAMNEIPKAVFTRKGYDPTVKGFANKLKTEPLSSSWAGARVFDGDLLSGIKELKAESGSPIVAHGGAEFMGSLIETGLIDEYHLITHPIALGTGLPIFDGLSKPCELKLVDAKVFPGGVIAHTYRPE